MADRRIDIYKEFAKQIEYPMVIFYEDGGEIIDCNYEASVIIGTSAQKLSFRPGRTFTADDEFWDNLHGKKCVEWRRIHLYVDGNSVIVSGIINEIEVEGKRAYAIIFSDRADLSLGSPALERMVNHAGIVAFHMRSTENGMQIDYVSQNINRYGYTREQLYDPNLHMHSLVSPEDWDALDETISEDLEERRDDRIYECRLLTEEQELIPVRILIHYVYGESYELSALEVLVVDRTHELKQHSENLFLANAISKMNNVLIVKKYHAGKRSLMYISPNASLLGINAEALTNGYKLTEDYIHPEDRDKVIDTVYQSIAMGVGDYSQVYRMIKDNGTQIWVNSDVTINRISDGEAEVSSLLSDITEKKELEEKLKIANQSAALRDAENKKEASEKLGRDDGEVLAKLQELSDVLTVNANYYCVVADMNGKLLTEPKGPADNLGQFFDMFERPQFKEEFIRLSEAVKQDKIPMSGSINMGGLTAHIEFAPILVEDNVTAFWIMTSFLEEGEHQLLAVVDSQWRLACSIADSFYADSEAANEAKYRELIEHQLHLEQFERTMVYNMITSLSTRGVAGLAEVFTKLGAHLEVDLIGVYLKDKETGNVGSFYNWTKTGQGSDVFDALEFTKSECEECEKNFECEEAFEAYRDSTNSFLRGLAERAKAVSILIIPMWDGKKLKGYFLFVDNNRQRKRTQRNVRMLRALAELFEGILLQERDRGMGARVTNMFFEAYDHVRDSIYVKDNETEEIVFANKAMEKLFGYSVKGMRSTEILKDRGGDYRNLSGLQNRFVANNRITKRQSYIKEVDQIMNIVEVKFESFGNKDYSLVILKKNKNKG